jgi:arginyl-tRNA synthetase
VYVSPVREGVDDEVAKANAGLAPATWFRSTTFGDDEDRVIVKSSGEPTYTLPDIAYHVDKIERGFDLLVNVLGADHKKQAEVVRYGLQALGYETDHLHVVFMQMMRMVRGGEEVKISTRRGQFITLDELIDMTSADAVQYFLLQRSPDSQLTFDVDLAVKQSNENPVYYIQYAYVRCAGIFREAEARGVSGEADADLTLLDDEAMAFIRTCLELPEQLEFAARNLSPHTIAHYALSLANQFHPMYDRVRVFGEGIDPDLAMARLYFYRAAMTVFRRVLRLMGMSAPERM